VWITFALFTVAAGVASMQSAWFSAVSRYAPVPLRAEDFRLRLAVANYSISDKDIGRAPAALHCQGWIGRSGIDFDLRLIPTVTSGSSRRRPLRQIWYEADHFTIRTLELLNRQNLHGKTVRFTVPWVLHRFAGPDTQFQAELFIRNQWYPSGYQMEESFEIEVSRSP
jgi:hypothetical protein